MCIIGVLKWEENGGQKKIWRNSGWKIYNFDNNYMPTDPRISMDAKHKKHEGNCTKAHNTQLLQG